MPVGIGVSWKPRNRAYLNAHLGFGEAGVFGTKEEAIHVGQLDLVIVKQQQFADTAPREHLGGNTADAADADDENGKLANILRRGKNVSPDKNDIKGESSTLPRSFQQFPCV